MTHDSLAPSTRRALARGRALYSTGRWFEAHDAWEMAWRVESGEVRTLLQGLILVAAGLVKATRDARPTGALKHFEAAAARLAPLPDACAGLALGAFREDLARATEAARRWRDGTAARLEAPPPRLDRAGRRGQ